MLGKEQGREAQPMKPQAVMEDASQPWAKLEGCVLEPKDGLQGNRKKSANMDRARALKSFPITFYRFIVLARMLQNRIFFNSF